MKGMKLGGGGGDSGGYDILTCPSEDKQKSILEHKEYDLFII